MPIAQARRLKTFRPSSFKAQGELADLASGEKLGPGEYIALASVFGNVDLYGDRMVKGAFTETLQEWADSGNQLSAIWSHNWNDPFANIGGVLWAKEVDAGLLYKAKIDVDDSEFAAQVYRLMKARRITQQSFGFDVLDGQEVIEDGKSIFDIKKVHLFEVGPCLVGVNQATELLDIKSGVPAPSGAGEPSGQEPAPAAGDRPSEDSSSDSESSASTKGMSPASAKLAIEIETFLGGIE